MLKTVTRLLREPLAEGISRTWQQPPTEQELTGLVEDYIKDEVYVREADHRRHGLRLSAGW